MVKLSKTLYEKAEGLWCKAVEQPFLVEMAKGTLNPVLYKEYMIQDYLYLLGYMDILREIRARVECVDLGLFVDRVLEETEKETRVVHRSAMKELGIREEEIQSAQMRDVLCAYLSYLHVQVEEKGVLAGLAALLQCSWNYAYIGQVMYAKYREEIEQSRYRSWFMAYADASYGHANQLWIDVVDNEAVGIDERTKEDLCDVFVTCAKYENLFWESLYVVSLEVEQ